MHRVMTLLLAAWAVAFPATVAGGTQTIRDVVYDFRQVAALAKGLERTLAARRARVALIGRIDLKAEIMPPGVRFSHAAIAVYSRIETRDGRLVPGYAIYNLYQGDARTGVSHLAQDYPVDYLAVSQKLEVGVIIPGAALQRALLATIFSDSYAQLHNPRYSAISNPFNMDFQNCTEFVVDVLFAAIYGTDDRRRLKANISAYFEPHPLQVDESRLRYVAGSNPDVTLEDHSGPVAIATFESIARFLQRFRLAEESFVFAVDPTTLYGSTDELRL